MPHVLLVAGHAFVLAAERGLLEEADVVVLAAHVSRIAGLISDLTDGAAA